MKILFLSPYVPLPLNFGGAIRIYHILKGLSKNHTVTLLTFGNEDQKELLNEHTGILFNDYHLVTPPGSWKYRRFSQLQALLSSSSFFSLYSKSVEMQDKINELLKTGNYDLVQIEFPSMGNFNFETDAVKILDEHNIEYDNFYRMWVKSRSPLVKLHYYTEYKKTRKEEINTCNKVDTILTVSERDRQKIKEEIHNTPMHVIPNGVDSEYFKPAVSNIEPYSMVFTGMMAYLPNHDGMHYFLDEIFPLILKEIPEAKIYIVGNRPPKNLLKRASKNVIITGYVDDVRPYVWNSNLYVVPLRMGGGTRLKVLEALAMKKPVLTTSIGCEGIDVVDNQSALISDNPQDFASKAIKLLKHTDMRDKLIKNGFNLIQTKYDWKIVSEKLDEVLQTLFSEREKTISSNILVERTF